MKTLSLFTFVVRLLALLPVILHADESARPNIIVILCDDLGYSDVGFNGAKDIKTPELDSLAANGTICTSAYVVHPFCGPSRMGLMTGRYPHEFGAPFNLPNSGLEIEEFNKQGIPVGEILISSVLQKAGYHTGAIGKWHMGIEPEFHPNQRGFDDFFGFLGGGHMYFAERYKGISERRSKAGGKSISEYALPLEHNGETVEETEYMTDALSREAVRFVNEAAEKKDRPFFLYLAYNAPHTPLEAKEDDLKLYEGITDKKRKIYAAMVHAVDRGVGKVVEALKTTGELDNTLIVFFSDNGGKTSAGATNTPLSKGKGSVTEGGFRVPMFFTWPGHVPAGRKFPHPISALDFYPTIAGLSGAAIPKGKVLDGKDIWKDFIAGENPRKGGVIYALRHRLGTNDVGVRSDQWKLVREGTGPWKLYDLDQDIGEKKDLAAQHPERVKTMVAQAEKWSRSHVEPLWYDNLEAKSSWKETGMPNYDKTFQVAPVAVIPAQDLPAKKTLSKGDSTKEDYIELERSKWEEKGWSWNQAKVEEVFNAIDTNDDGIASGAEKKQYWENQSK